jgi:voltage-dependent calcium channel L type alpha-1C
MEEMMDEKYQEELK